MKDALTKRDGLTTASRRSGSATKRAASLGWAALPPGGLFGERAGEAIFQAAHQLISENDRRSSMRRWWRTWAARWPPDRYKCGGGARHFWVTITCLIIVALSAVGLLRRFRAVPPGGASRG